MAISTAAVEMRREARALGSPLRLTVAGRADAAAVDLAWAAVIGTFDEVDRAMSRFREDSDITKLNRARRPLAGLSRHLTAALVAADRANRMTGGRFDARVVGALESLGFAAVRQSLTSPIGPAPRAERPIQRFMRRDGRRGEIELIEPVDLGGIGKGLALRWAARRAAAELGPVGFLLEAGGDLVSRGHHDNAPWSIGIEDPLGGRDLVAVVVLDREQAIATSSIRVGQRRAAAGGAVHHLIDPRTGAPGGAGLVAVTVAWADPAWAEVWSKALFLEGADAIGAAARRRGLAAWWVSESGQLSMTPAARQQTSWVRGEAVA
jgi:thiamine biosynthesis lipoprotein